MSKKVIVTGSSGFVGTRLCRALAKKYEVYAIDIVKPSSDAGDINFIQLDLRNKKEIKAFFDGFEGECYSLINLAAYYDFSNKPSENYTRLIESLPTLFNCFQSIKSPDAKFIQASSMAAIKPCLPGEKITSDGERLAPWRYPEFKIFCENTLRDMDSDGSYVEVVLAAIYSDYAELVPLYQLLMVQKNCGINRFFYPGKLDRGLTYLHINDAVDFFMHLLDLENPPSRILVGEDEAYSHGEIFRVSDEFLYGFKIPKFPVPKFIAKIGSKVLLKLNPNEFIQPWMIALSDEYFSFDMSETKRQTGWKAKHYIGKKMDTILTNMKNDAQVFEERNKLRPWTKKHWKQL